MAEEGGKGLTHNSWSVMLAVDIIIPIILITVIIVFIQESAGYSQV